MIIGERDESSAQYYHMNSSFVITDGKAQYVYAGSVMSI